MAARNKLPSLTTLKRYLSRSVFDPRAKVGPMKIITEVGKREYWEGRAVEMIVEAQEAMMEGNAKQYHHNIQMALSLLGLAACTVPEPGTPEIASRSEQPSGGMFPIHQRINDDRHKPMLGPGVETSVSSRGD